MDLLLLWQALTRSPYPLFVCVANHPAGSVWTHLETVEPQSATCTVPLRKPRPCIIKSVPAIPVRYSRAEWHRAFRIQSEACSRLAAPGSRFQDECTSTNRPR